VASALRVVSAFPDPPFEVASDPPSGLDVDLMQAVADRLGPEPWRGVYGELER